MIRALLPALSLLGLVACGTTYDTSKDDPTESESDTEASESDPTDTEDTEPEGTDADGDGVTVEEGDCDDNNLYATPGRDEDTNDDIDNDCDGRIDEKFEGLFTILYNDEAADVSRSVLVDNLGNDTTEIDMDDVYYASFLTDDVDKISFIGTASDGIIVRYNRDGSTETIADLSEVEWEEEDEPAGFAGLAAHPDGYYLLSGIDRLYKVESDGSYEELASWLCLEEDGSHELYLQDIAVDWQTGEVLLAGLGGGVATWSEEDGVTHLVMADLENLENYYYTVEYKDGGGFYAMGASVSEGDYALYRYNASDQDFVLKGTWGRDATPIDLTIEDNDAYVSATGGWHNYIYKWPLDGGTPEFLYDSGEAEEAEDFSGVSVYYSVDGE